MKPFFFTCVCLLIGSLFFVSCSSATVDSEDTFEAVEFPDGSRAYLNQHSWVRYQKDFKTRVVEIQGEVFFEVEPGDTPFIVRFPLGEVEVLGTEFSVTATDETFDLEVEEGIVSVNTKTEKTKVKKGEHAVIKVNQSKIQVGKAEFKYRVWMKELRTYFKSMGKEFKKGSKAVKKESKEFQKDFNRGIKKITK